MITLLENLEGALRVGITLIMSPLARNGYNRWGATDAEVIRPLPGDDLVTAPKLGYTRAITINAPVAEVWPWLAQFGQGRGGLYSYDGLENLVGCDIHSVDRLLPEHQTVKPGDLIRLGRDGYPCQRVALVDAPHVLVMLGADPKTQQAPDYPEAHTDTDSVGSWLFFLEEMPGNRTRLIVRQRLDFGRKMALMWRIVETLNFVMERKMLLGIKARAERAG